MFRTTINRYIGKKVLVYLKAYDYISHIRLSVLGILKNRDRDHYEVCIEDQNFSNYNYIIRKSDIYKIVEVDDD